MPFNPISTCVKLPPLRTPCVTRILQKYTTTRPIFNASAMLQIAAMPSQKVSDGKIAARKVHTHELDDPMTMDKLGWTPRHGKASHHWARSVGIRYQRKTRQESFPFETNLVLVHPHCNPSPFPSQWVHFIATNLEPCSFCYLLSRR